MHMNMYGISVASQMVYAMRYVYFIHILGFLCFTHIRIQVNHAQSSGTVCVGFRCCVGRC